MSKFIILILSILFSSTPAEFQQKEPETTYYLIRHAEKDRSNSSDRDPQLTEKGKERAANWANILKEIDLDAVYSTPYARTMQTAQPTATKNNVRIQNYDSKNLYSKEFQEATKGKKVLVVGHSNTTPQFVNAILQHSKYDDIDDDENGALYIVKIYDDGSMEDSVEYHN